MPEQTNTDQDTNNQDPADVMYPEKDTEVKEEKTEEPAEEEKTEEKQTDTEEVAYEFKAPEGMEMDVDTKLLESFKQFAKTENISQESFQKLGDMYAERMMEMQKSYKAAEAAQLEKWEAEIKAMPNSEESLAHAKNFLSKFGDEETIALYEAEKIGSHPGTIRMLAKAGALLSEPSIKEGAVSSDSDILNTMYNNTP